MNYPLRPMMPQRSILPPASPAGGNLQPMVPAQGQAPMMTPGQIARQRTVAEALMAPNNRPITNWGDGAAGLVDAFSGNMKMRQADAAEQRLYGYDQQLRSQAFGLPPAPTGGGIGGMMPAQPQPSFGGFVNRLFGRG